MVGFVRWLFTRRIFSVHKDGIGIASSDCLALGATEGIDNNGRRDVGILRAEFEVEHVLLEGADDSEADGHDIRGEDVNTAEQMCVGKQQRFHFLAAAEGTPNFFVGGELGTLWFGWTVLFWMGEECGRKIRRGFLVCGWVW